MADDDNQDPISLIGDAENPLFSFMPSSDTLEEIAVKILDALIKRGQMAMAMSAFQTQLEVLKKVQPEQVRSLQNYSNFPVK